MADLQQTMGTVIRRERRERGLTLKDLAERSVLSLVYLGEIERGKKYPSASVLERLAEALGYEVPDLLELVADALRAERVPVLVTTDAIGFRLPARAPTPRTPGRGIVRMLKPPAMAA